MSSEVALDVLDLTKKVSPNYSLLPTTRPVQHRNVLLTMRAVKTEMSRVLTPLVLA